MTQIEMNGKIIEALASRAQAVVEGFQLYHKGNVREIVFDKVKRKLRAQVEDNKTYKIAVDFTALFRVRFFNCTCPESFQQSGACRHVVAALKTLQSKEELTREKQEYDRLQAEAAKAKAEQKEREAEAARLKSEARKKSKSEKEKAKALLAEATLKLVREIAAEAAKTNDNTVKPPAKPPNTGVAPAKKSLAAEELLAFFTGQAQEPYQESLNLEYWLQVNTGRVNRAELTLKIGLQRLYVVKDLGALLDAMKSGHHLEFGKQFIFESYRQRFRDHDLPVVELLLEMLDQHQAWNQLNYTPYGYSQTSVFPKRNLPLHGVYLPKFLDALGDNPLMLTLDSQPPRLIRVNREGLPLEYQLESQGQDLALSLNLEQFPWQLTPDGKYYIDQREIYQATPQQQQILPPIIRAFRQEKSKKLILPSQKRDVFVSEALPMIKKTGKIAVTEELAQRFSQEKLVPKIFLERNSQNGIAARVEFHYGETRINPFAPEDSNGQIEGPDIILIRNSEEERRILNLLERAEFTTRQGKIHLDDEEKIFILAQTYLPELQEIAELYYAEDLKFHIKNTLSFTGKVRLDEKLDLLEISFQYNELTRDELRDVFQALNIKKKFFRLKDGSFLNLKQPGLENVADLFDNLGLRAEDVCDDRVTLPKYQALYLENYLRQSKVPGIQRNMAYKQLIESILEPQDTEYEVPLSLDKVLRDYQKTGFKWLKSLSFYGLGGILADDMGLGKTLQVLSFILSEKESKVHPALVVAPTSLVYNWQEEARRFTPELRVLVIDGTPSERQGLLADGANYDLIITSYPLLRRDTEHYGELSFSYCFLDEAQHIKNPQTINAKSVQEIKAQGYFALTGTPIENSLSELWSLFNFVMPGYLLSQTEFRKRYELPIVKGEDSKQMVELSRHVTPFILRRLKKDVLLELPDKIESRLTAQMTPEQTRIYLAYWQEAKQTIAQEIQSAGFEKSQIKILAALTRLRQICSHPAMFLEDFQGDSGKMLLFQEVLEDALDSGHRVLVFSQFTSMLEIIRQYLLKQDIANFYLQGSTPAPERLEMVHAFNAGQGKVFLISLKAGGTGLNLTGADTVIHFDPWWNPAVEDQATDRAHRIGQKNAVQVIRLVTQGTIEEKVYALQEKKKQLIQSVIQPGETFLSKLSKEELLELFE